MKKGLLSILAIFSVLMSFAQIPNFSFENWTTVGSYEIPNQWGTMNNKTATFSVFTATKAAPGNPGNYYLNLTSKTVSATVVNGIAVSGKLDSITLKPISGFPYNLQPASLTGKWQHMIYGTSQGSVKAALTKWNTSLNKRDTIALAAQTLVGMAMSWASFAINFSYFSSVAPDSCIIELKASGSAPTNQDYLWVDDLALTGSVTGIVNLKNSVNSMIIYPNPGSGNVMINLDVKNLSQITLQLTDIQGKVILTNNLGVLQGESKHSINLSGISKGTYFVQVLSNNGMEVKTAIID